MHHLSGLDAIPAQCKNAVVVIGNFDGVHKGHQALLKRAKQIAADLGAPCGVLTFEPHPRRLFRPDEPPGRITPIQVKGKRLEKAGVDFVVSLNFDWDFASKSPDYFVETVLKDRLQARHVIVGYNFRFGQLRKGCPETIKAAGLDVTIIEQVQQQCGGNVSSSAVRQALRQGDVLQANAILGWHWEIQGEVVKGDQRGRELGYPTANIKLEDTIHPAYGIYAARLQVEGDDRWHHAAVNIGIRPMFEIPTAQVEAHILDFDQDIYGKIIRVQPIKRLRGEAKFDSLDALIVQMDQDCVQAREILVQYDNAN